MKTIFHFTLLMQFSLAYSQTLEFSGKPEIVAPGIVCKEKSEVKITFSKDKKLVLWGAI